ncbi:MAG TPA: MOSC domain-containing protein [Dehalococcoidia bacterium]|jgi:MOSC domain-containing protein YiiM|nr:MOSC domain-containing protein [Dehalococcoidia bacterium]
MSGQIVSIHIASKAEATMTAVDEVRAVAGRGLEGDRYFLHEGTYSETPGTGRDITFIASEAIEEVARDHNIRLAPGESRRNVTTKGIDLNALVDKEFRAGEVVLRGMRLCEPCEYLQGHTGKDGLRKALVHRGGLRADIISGGTIRVGDEIVAS